MKKFPLSESELEFFHSNGFIGPFDAYDSQEIKEVLKPLRRELLDTSKSIYNSKKAISGVTNIANYDRHLDIEFLFQHINKREIVDRIASILGDDLLCWRTEFFPKYPGDEGTDWHQVKDFSAVNNSKKPHIRWPENANFAGTINVWTALTDATIDMGCMQFIPGTHGAMYYDEKKEIAYEPSKINCIEKNGSNRGFFGYDFSELKVDANWQPKENEAISMELKAGQFIIFWSTLLHASYPHLGKTNQMRLAYTARYVPTSVEIYPDMEKLAEFGGEAPLSNYRPVLVSGKNNFAYNNAVKEMLPFNLTPPSTSTTY